MQTLKLAAFEPDDLAVISAHLQDAVLKARDIAFDPKQARFVLLLNRFDWEDAHKSESSRMQGQGKFTRRRAALRIERALGAQSRGLPREDAGAVLSLLSIGYEPGAEAPAGFVSLQFAGGAALRVKVECLEVAMEDLGEAWETTRRPDHDADDGSAEGAN